MRRILFLLLLTITSLSSCNNENMIWDIAPVVVKISVVDAQGNDLLNPQTDNALELGKIKAIYNGQDYLYGVSPDDPKSKAYLPRFYGLMSEFNSHHERHILSFGEFDGAESYTNESVTIVWPDGSSDIIRFNRVFKWKSNGSPSIKQEWFLNDAKASDDVIKIIKESILPSQS